MKNKIQQKNSKSVEVKAFSHLIQYGLGVLYIKEKK